MKKIAIDMNPVIHGSRAIKRCTGCMVNQLLHYPDIDIYLIYFDYKKQKNKYLRIADNHVNEFIVPFPQRIFLPFWKRFHWPVLESFLPESDIFYTNEFYFPPTKKTKILATIHGLAYKIIPDKLPQRGVEVCNNGLAYILDHADYLVAVSETTRKELVEHVKVEPERIYVITHGVDKKFRNRKNQQSVYERMKNIYHLKRPFILFVGAIGVHKNVFGLLNAFLMISDKIPHDLILVGPPDSAWDGAHKFVIENNMSKRVRFLGSIDQGGDNLVDIYNAAEVFVFPSFYEGWTSPPLEAMACGTPVIASNCSSLPETLGDAAILTDPDDHLDLAAKMESVLADKTLQLDLIRRGFEHVRKHTWEKSADKLRDVFADVDARGFWKK